MPQWVRCPCMLLEWCPHLQHTTFPELDAGACEGPATEPPPDPELPPGASIACVKLSSTHSVTFKLARPAEPRAAAAVAICSTAAKSCTRLKIASAPRARVRAASHWRDRASFPHSDARIRSIVLFLPNMKPSFGLRGIALDAIPRLLFLTSRE